MSHLLGTDICLLDEKMDQYAHVDWTIIPNTGVGKVRFGQSRSTIRSILGPASKTFKKVPFAESEADEYKELGIHLYYDQNDCLESIDAWGPSKINFDGIWLLGRGATDVANDLKERSGEDSNFSSEELGFSLYTFDNTVKGVTVFTRGYHDLANPNSGASRAKRAYDEWRQNRKHQESN